MLLSHCVYVVSAATSCLRRILEVYLSKTIPRKERVLKHKRMALKRAAQDKGQSKVSFFKTPRKDPEESRNATSVSVAESFGESSGVDKEAQVKEINENEKSCSEKTSEDNDKSISSSEDNQSTEVGDRAVEGGSFNQRQEKSGLMI